MAMATIPQAVNRVAVQRTQPVVVAGLGRAVPPRRMTQQESLEYILANFKIREGTKTLYKKVLGNAAIETRHFCLEPVDEILETDHERINARFERWAVKLSAESLQEALAEAQCTPRQIDFLATTTCTGYLCPGLSSYTVEACGLNPNTQLVDLAGMGCGAAIPALHQAANFVRINPGTTAAVVSTEICSAAMYSGDAPDLVISNAIFGDGSAAVLLRSPSQEVSGAEAAGTRWPLIQGFASILIPEWRDTLRFRTDGGHLRNVLGREVPERAAQALDPLVGRLLEEHGLERGQISHWLLHAGGVTVLDAIRDTLRIPEEQLTPSRQILKRYGNMSSPTVLFVLHEALASRRPKPEEWGVLASFGAGFSAHAALLKF